MSRGYQLLLNLEGCSVSSVSRKSGIFLARFVLPQSELGRLPGDLPAVMSPIQSLDALLKATCHPTSAHNLDEARTESPSPITVSGVSLMCPTHGPESSFYPRDHLGGHSIWIDTACASRRVSAVLASEPVEPELVKSQSDLFLSDALRSPICHLSTEAPPEQGTRLGENRYCTPEPITLPKAAIAPSPVTLKRDRGEEWVLSTSVAVDVGKKQRVDCASRAVKPVPLAKAVNPAVKLSALSRNLFKIVSGAEQS